MYRNMVTSLMLHGRIKTTEAKAKELRSIADKVITMGKRVPLSSLEGLKGDELAAAKAKRLHNIRRAANYVHDKGALTKVFEEYAERFKERPGGYTRIYKLGFRPGDNAPMALIELVGDYTPTSPSQEAAAPVAEAAEAEAVDEAVASAVAEDEGTEAEQDAAPEADEGEPAEE
jgi:large subunit ribosomal protein L17